MHWAGELVGKPWAPATDGPASFDCWGLVRYVFRERFGVEMPAVGERNVSAIKRAAQASRWRRAEAPGQADDILLLHGIRGRHVGVILKIGRRLMLLHANGCLRPNGRPMGCVELQPVDEVLAEYRLPEYWRRA